MERKSQLITKNLDWRGELGYVRNINRMEDWSAHFSAWFISRTVVNSYE